MSTSVHVLLKADPCLEGDLADDKADSLVCLQLNQISVLQYFFLEMAQWTTNMCLDPLFCCFEILATVVALFLQTGKGGKWQVIWCLSRPQTIHDVGFCVSLQCGCLTSFWWKEP